MTPTERNCKNNHLVLDSKETSILLSLKMGLENKINKQ